MPISNLQVRPGGATATQSPYATSAYGGGGGGPYGGWLDQMFRMKMMMAQEQLKQMQYGGQLQGWQAQMAQQQAARDAAQQNYAMKMGTWQAKQQARAQEQQMRMQRQAARPYMQGPGPMSLAQNLQQWAGPRGKYTDPLGRSLQNTANVIGWLGPQLTQAGLMQTGQLFGQQSGSPATSGQLRSMGQGSGSGKYAKGTLPGTVPRTGPYQLHEGEVVVPAPQVDQGLVAALVGDARRKGVPLGQAKGNKMGCGSLGRYQIGSLGQPGAEATDLLKFQQMRQGAMPPTQMGLPMAGGQAPSAWPSYLQGLGQTPGAPGMATQMELPFSQAASELDSLAMKEPMHASFIRKAKGLLAKGRWGEFDGLVRKMSKGRARVVGGSIAAIGAGVAAYNLKRNAEEPDAPKTPEAKDEDTILGGLGRAAKEVSRAYTGYPVEVEDVPITEPPMTAPQHALRRAGLFMTAQDVPPPEPGLPPVSAAQFATQQLTGEEAPSREVQRTQLGVGGETPPPLGGEEAMMGPFPAAAPPPQAQFGLAQALEQVGAAPEGEPYEGIFGKGTRPQQAPSGTIELTGKLSEREKAFRELEGMPQQRDARHTAGMARASATNIYTTLMKESNRLSPEAYKSLKDEADRQMNLSMKFEGIAKSREKALEDELKSGADLSAAIAKIGATQRAMTQRQLTVEDAKALNRQELTKLRETAETLRQLRMRAVSGTRRERQLAQDSIADILLEIARVTGYGDATGEEIDRVAAEMIQLPEEEFDAAMEGIRTKLNQAAGVR